MANILCLNLMKRRFSLWLAILLADGIFLELVMSDRLKNLVLWMVIVGFCRLKPSPSEDDRAIDHRNCPKG